MTKTYDPYMQDNLLNYSDSLRFLNLDIIIEDYTIRPQFIIFMDSILHPEQQCRLLAGRQQIMLIQSNGIILAVLLAFTTQFDKHEIKAGGSFKDGLSEDICMVGIEHFFWMQWIKS